MQKKPALIIAALIFGGIALYLWNKNEQTRAYALRIICWTIAKDLITNTNSQRVALIDSSTSTNFSRFLAGGAEVEKVKLGDELKHLLPLKDYAKARLYFTNQSGKHFELRIQVQSPTNFTVIGAGHD